MNSIRRQATRGSGRSTLLLLSVLALLALACFPILAQASGSGTVEYDPALPNAEGKGPSHGEGIAESSESPKNGGAEAPSGTGSGESSYTEEAPSEEGGAVTGNGGKGQGSPEKGANPPVKAGVQQAAPIAKSTASDTSDDGGSSPLVPILIGIGVLAAISIAVVMIRQRRQRDGASPSLSTKAG